MNSTNRTTKNIAILYANADASLKKELCVHLKSMQRSGLITLIESAQRESIPHLDIILILISPTFLADDMLVNATRYALSSHKQGNQRIIPILLRPANPAHDLPELGDKKALPRNGRPVMGQNRDRAFADIAGEIRTLVERWA